MLLQSSRQSLEMLIIPDNAQDRELSTPNARDVEVAELCSRALEVITMTSEVTLDLKDSIARISEGLDPT